MNNSFKIRISLTHVKSGKTVEWEEEWGKEYDPRFIWEDGNYSCNCNRDLFFHAAEGTPESDLNGTMNCVEFDDYRVNWIKNLETGNIIYEETAQ